MIDNVNSSPNISEKVRKKLLNDEIILQMALPHDTFESKKGYKEDISPHKQDTEQQ